MLSDQDLQSHINRSDEEKLKETILTLEGTLREAKRQLLHIQEQHRKKVKFISYEPKGGNGEKSSSNFIYNAKRDVRWPVLHCDFEMMTKTEQDTIIITLIDGIAIANNKKGHIVYWMNGKAIVQNYYKVGKDRLDRIAGNVWTSLKNGEITQSCVIHNYEHGNSGKKPYNKLSSMFDEHLRIFLSSLDGEPMPFNYIAGKENVTTLPPSTDRNALYGEFLTFLHERGVNELCGYSTFLQKIKETCPNFLILDSMKDVCDVCCRSRLALNGSSRLNYNAFQKKVSQELQEHVKEMRNRRIVYFFDRTMGIHGQSSSEKKEEVWKTLCKRYEKDQLLVAKWIAVGASHYVKVFTFDFKQCLSIPYDPIQPAHYFYHSKRSCHVFGVVEEHHATPYHIFLYDECDGGKTADEIITILSSVIQGSSVGSNDHLILYADNCSGQNKNRYLVAFMVALLLKKVCASVRMKFLVVGHTHNNCDRAFGYCEKRFRKNQIHHPTDALSVLQGIKGMQSKLIDSFRDYRSVCDTHLKDVKGIHDAAELLVHEDNPTEVLLTTNTLSCAVFPDVQLYEKKIQLLKSSTTKEELLEAWNNSPMTAKKQLTEAKTEHLKQYFVKGLVRKDLYQYYSMSDDSSWSRKGPDT